MNKFNSFLLGVIVSTMFFSIMLQNSFVSKKFIMSDKFFMDGKFYKLERIKK